ncbi:MAG TPA: hypothetical protein DEF68_11230 [Elusimicrobia bacterium]|nr:hypothetical protein [Elusimicrobiota bacterium]HBW23935.1 hypothetical protein [Elusimicrobiota bacterium]
MRKMLFVNPAADVCGVPHAGLASLAAVLRQHGHTVKVADYHFSSKTPALESILEDFRPDVAGISLFSCMAGKADRMIETIKKTKIPLLCGGPHAASYFEELSKDARFDYVVVGEAENVISELVENAVVNAAPRLIRPALPDVPNLPFPDYSPFYDHEGIRVYPLITSRGCPFNCSFCCVKLSNSKAWRPRSPAACIDELKKAGARLPLLREVMIWDDNFSLDIRRAKDFLRLYIAEGFKYKLSSANLRADKIDKEFLLLLKDAGCDEVQFGVEHGDAEVFGHIGKGETLADIERGAGLVNECGMKLGCSFIIGLPYDTPEKTLVSIRFAEKLKPDHVHWNILVPYKGTKAYEYFKKNGRIDDGRIPFTLQEDGLLFEPNADTPEFTSEERKKAYLTALLSSKDAALLRNLARTFSKAREYGLATEFVRWLLAPKILRGLLRQLIKSMLGTVKQ